MSFSALLLTGCGTAADVTPSDLTQTITVTAPPKTVTVTASPPPAEASAPPTEASASPTEASPSPSEAPTDPSAQPGTILPPSDQTLGLSDFFQPDRSWEEGRWNVADRRDQRGISATFSYGTKDLELRLQNEFNTLQFSAGQTNDSTSSTCTTSIDITVDGELRETREFGFNTLQTFEDVDVRDGNAVVIDADPQRCSDGVRILLYDIQLQ